MPMNAVMQELTEMASPVGDTATLNRMPLHLLGHETKKSSLQSQLGN